MSDELENLFERLRGQQPPAPFAFPEAIRRRGRQRTQRQALAAGLAVVAVAGAGAGWAANLGPVDRPPSAGATRSTTPPSPSQPVPSASPTPSAASTSTPINLSARALRTEDLGPGSWRLNPPHEPFSGDLWNWDLAQVCPAYRTPDYPSLRQQVTVETTGWWAGQATSYVFEHLHQYRPGWGPRALDDVRRVLATCAESSKPRERRGVVARGFAGDEALLVREEVWPAGSAQPLVTLTAVVRVGDLVATVKFSPDRDQQSARAVARAAANRLAG